MQELKKTDAALYELKLQDIALEDVIFAMVGNHRSETDASKKDAIRSALREKVKALLELRIRERQREIDRLQERQNEEKANFDEFVNQRVRRELEGPEKVVSRADGPRPGRLRQPTTQESPTSVPHAP